LTAGALHGVRVIELGGIGPGPHAAMVLADHGADVVRVERAGGPLGIVDPGTHLHRSRRLIRADLKDPADLAAVLDLVAQADVVIEGFRPGVAERLGLGPSECRARNSRLVYGRMTGWGQTGPLAAQPGHDINYLAVTGALHGIGRQGERPVPPMNLVADFGGGSMLLVIGVLTALYERNSSGVGQVVDAAMVDGVSLLMQMVWSMYGAGQWRDERGTNLPDSGAPFYDTYRCADGRFVAVGAMEPRFYAALLAGLGLAGDSDLPPQEDRAGWPELRTRFTAVFATRTRDEWAEAFAGTEACVSPVLALAEASRYPHLQARATLVDVDGITTVSPAPRLSRSGCVTPRVAEDADLDAVTREWRAAAES